MFLSYKMLFAMQNKDFNVFTALLQSKLCSSFNSQNHLFRVSRITDAVLV